MEEEDLDIEEEDCNIKENDEYIERVCAINWDYPPIVVTILKILVKETRLSWIKIMSYTYIVSP